jgi:hypothetical protein
LEGVSLRDSQPKELFIEPALGLVLMVVELKPDFIGSYVLELGLMGVGQWMLLMASMSSRFALEPQQAQSP